MASSPVLPFFSQTSPTDARTPGGREPAMARLMQIKVLYTFDDEKTTCLARCPQPIPVHTLQLEDSTEIGIVELRTCIRAIVAASPELVAKLGQDYTIYAYDYSEYETPLVGQGMLSWALASTSATPTAPADQSRTPVTGRVTRNVRSLFPNAGPQEILQVKLKLVPVPTALQGEYAEGMEKYRDANNYSRQGFDPAAWNAFLQARQTFGSPFSPAMPAQSQTPPPLLPPGPQNSVSVYAPQPVSSHPQEPPQFVFQASTGAAPVMAPSVSKLGSRPASPRGRRGSNASRPSSRTSTRGKGQKQTAPSLQRTDSITQNAVPTSESGDPDGGPTRKRACIQQADWRGPSVFDTGNEPLRVAASAAASIRGSRPSISGHPTAADIAAAEPGPRPPTPVPTFSRLPRNDSSSSNEAKAQKSRWYRSPYAMTAEATDAAASEAPSPEDVRASVGSTPADIPSSPPIIHHAAVAPTSPHLPSVADHPDSGFVSGALDECHADNEYEHGTMSLSKSAFSAQPGYHADTTITQAASIRAGSQGQRPKLAPKTSSYRQRAGSIPGSSPRLPPLIGSRAEATSPDPMYLDTDMAMLTDAPHAPQRPPLQHSESMPADLEAAGISGAKKSSRAHQSIQTRMNEDIAAGKMPPFCKNCGEIDTPTWRNCYVKNLQGSPELANVDESEKNFICCETVEKDAQGMTIAYRIIKKSVSKEDEGFEQLQLCNSCGIWLFKTKAMRPPERWAKAQQKSNKPSRKRPSRAKTDSALPGSLVEGLELPTEDLALWSALTTDGPYGDSNEWALTDVSGRSDKSLPKSFGKRAHPATETGAIATQAPPRFLADQPAALALQRAIQSSPPQFPGSKSRPIDLSAIESPRQDVRRLLFPSPRKDGEMKTLDGSPSTGTPTKTGDIGVIHMKDPFADTSADQENQNGLMVTPTKKKSRLDAVKTPTRSSPRLAAKNQGNRLAEQGVMTTKPETPTRAASQHFAGAEMTPFTASLNQMMSDGIAAFGAYDGTANDPSGMFTFSDFSNIDDFGLDAMGLPQSDADWFPIHDDTDMAGERWNGGPLLDGELDELLKDAGEDAFLDMTQQIGDGVNVGDGHTPMSSHDFTG